MLEECFFCIREKNGFFNILIMYGIVVMFNVDYGKGMVIFILIFDGIYDFYEEFIISFFILDKLVCDFIFFLRNLLVDIVEMIIVVEIM